MTTTAMDLNVKNAAMAKRLSSELMAELKKRGVNTLSVVHQPAVDKTRAIVRISRLPRFGPAEENDSMISVIVYSPDDTLISVSVGTINRNADWFSWLRSEKRAERKNDELRLMVIDAVLDVTLRNRAKGGGPRMDLIWKGRCIELVPSDSD